jgi:hypothetical protein
MKCNVCNEDKELKQFHTYWHSTQQKMRTRKQCIECFYNKRMKNKNPDKYYENNPNYHKCNTCMDWKEKKLFYTSKDKIYSNRCRFCTKEFDYKKRIEHLEQSCGGDKVPPKPNKYSDEYQKACTHQLMQLMGYTFDEPTGIWIKPGVKELVNGKPFFPKVIKSKKVGTKITSSMLKTMIELYKSGWGYQRISKKLGCSDTTVFKYIKKHYDNGKIN